MKSMRLAIAATAGAGIIAAALWLKPASTATADGAAPISAADVRELADLPLVAARLRDRLAKQPSDAQGWALLARTYARIDQHALAAEAYAKALALAPKDAELLADYADTLAFLNGRSFEGEPSRLIDRALALDPVNRPALLLAGLAAYDRKEFAVAVNRWERLIDVAGPDSALGKQAGQGIAEARKRLAGHT